MLRLTDIEYERICGEAEATGYPVAVYARKKLIDEQTTIKYEIVADMPELQKLTSEYIEYSSLATLDYLKINVSNNRFGLYFSHIQISLSYMKCMKEVK